MSNKNLKKLYDAAYAAKAEEQRIAGEISTLLDADKVVQAQEMRPKLDIATAEAKEANQLYLAMLAASGDNSLAEPGKNFIPVGSDTEPENVKNLRASKVYQDTFFDALKAGVTIKNIGQFSAEKYAPLMNALTETGGTPAGAEGGFLLPTDFDNLIREQMRLAVDLSPFVNVEEVTMFSGWRAVEKASAALPFAKINEADFPSGERIPSMESPEFVKVEYEVDDYAGYLPVARNLFADTPANIMKYLSRWVGRKTSLTNTYLILAIMNALTP